MDLDVSLKMLLALNLTLAICGVSTAALAIFGETYRHNIKGLFTGLTGRGWIALVLLLATLVAGIIREFKVDEENKETQLLLVSILEQTKTYQDEYTKSVEDQLDKAPTNSSEDAELKKSLEEALSDLRQYQNELHIEVTGIGSNRIPGFGPRAKLIQDEIVETKNRIELLRQSLESSL